MKVEMSFNNDSNVSVYDEKYFEHLAGVIFDHLELDDYFIFEVNLVDRTRIHEINREYRHIDRPTDVISFAFEDRVEGEKPIIRVSGMPRDLGEIFICVDKAKEQAAEYDHSLDREMAFLFTHGLLHLLGYDHQNASEEKTMFDIQDRIMEILHL